MKTGSKITVDANKVPQLVAGNVVTVVSYGRAVTGTVISCDAHVDGGWCLVTRALAFRNETGWKGKMVYTNAEISSITLHSSK
jgi:hypothetical protein